MADAPEVPAVSEEAKPDADTLQVLRDLANRLRIHSIKATCTSSSGHPTSCSSAAEIMSVLLFHVMRYKEEDPENPNNDRFILCKQLAFFDMAIGWYGQGLGTACGMAYTGKYFDKARWNTYVVDGRDVETLCAVFWQATQVKDKPTAVIAKTFKGRGMPSIEDAESWHGRPMPTERADAIIKLIESQIETNRHLEPKPPVEDSPQVNITDIQMTSPPAYQVGEKVATRKACGLALAKLGHANERVIVLDGDTKNSTFSEMFKKEHAERFIECFIAEQNMVNVALGCAIRGRTIAFVSTFAAFLSRAFNQIQMGAIFESNINIVGSHCGISVGEDGASQMALEDLAMFRAIPNCTIFYPSDAISTEHAVFLAANTKGICYIRTNRPETDVIYTPQDNFGIGQAKVICHSVNDKVTVIGAGVTLHEVLAAAADLSKEDISVRVIDLFTIKPLDAATIISNAKCTGGRIITVEDHHPEGGIGEAVCAAVSMEPDILVHRLAVQGVPRSGKSSELLDMFGISTKHIIEAVKSILTN
ncbi:transketolase like 1 [Phyllostomus discolor]|uniref:transketolase n=1 Tax=Phyllostomus discolor TaxID=89673 RepID=A0A833ZHP0_9CHIR|nr:transketolase like 1 [Phyllostomus discolor]